jgi:hypothetical protein
MKKYPKLLFLQKYAYICFHRLEPAMKKLVTLILCIIAVFPVFAKNDKDSDEISIVYGQATVPQFAYVMGEVFGAMFSLGHASFENPHMFGAAGVEYVHYVNDWLGFGGAVMCDYMSATTVSVDKDGNKTPNGQFKLGCLSTMPLVKFAWLNREHVGLYSKVAAGAGYFFANGGDAKDNFSVALQLTPVGVDFGGEQFRGFVEAGVGMQGIVSGGVRWFF